MKHYFKMISTATGYSVHSGVDTPATPCCCYGQAAHRPTSA